MVDRKAPTLRLHNTLTRSKDVFVPIDETNVRLYVCGPTVYDYAHIGNARPIIVFDLLFRLLREVYGPSAVTYVRNITDVDDKINARAARDFPNLPHNEAIRRVTQKTEEQFHADIRALGVLMPDEVNESGQPPRFVEPRATEHIAEMREIIERLIARGVAYVAVDHVLFSVSSMASLPKVPQYGAFSKRSLDELLSGARVDVAPYKRDAMDFVLWKPSGPNDPSWPSPGGIAAPGRPGWHIECSAMAWKHLISAFETRLKCDDPDARQTFDIHGGGIDLVFPHHENEIAQSCCAFDTARMANVWMHNGFLQVESEKMSKSLGNFVTIHELLETPKFGSQKWHGRVLKLAMLMTHYRQPIDWTVERLVDARNNLYDWNMLCHDVPATSELPGEIVEPLLDDLNTPGAVAALHALARTARSEASGDVASRAKLRRALELLGLYEPGPAIALLKQDVRDRAFDEKVDALIAARVAARAARNWAESDRIRDEIVALGVVLMDNKDGTTTWEVSR